MGKTISCPKCRAPMQLVQFDTIEVDRCTGCGGIWFDGRERERLRAMKGSEIIDSGDPRVGKQQNKLDRICCPRCTTPMVRMVDPAQSHLWYEACSVCGGCYLDAGEFRDDKSPSLLGLLRDLFTPPRS